MSDVTLHGVLTNWQTGPTTMLLYLGLVAAAAIYVTAAARPSPRGRRWPRTRTAWFLAALALLALIYGSGLQTYEDNPTVHVVLHMVVMMAVAPLLAFSAPITLLLRTLPAGARRAVVRQLKGPAFRPLGGRWAPIVLCVDYYLTMFVYQLTPLRTLSEQSPLLHSVVHQYMLVCGLLFWLPLAAVDPVRFRPGRRAKLLMIAAGVAAFGLLGAIEIARGQSATGWAYIVAGATLTTAAAVIVGVRERRRLQSARPFVREPFRPIAPLV
jgi:putative membrane protein